MLTSHTCTNQTNLIKGFVSGDATIRAPAAASSDFVLKARVRGWLVFFGLVLFFKCFSDGCFTFRSALQRS